MVDNPWKFIKYSFSANHKSVFLIIKIKNYPYSVSKVKVERKGELEVSSRFGFTVKIR